MNDITSENAEKVYRMLGQILDEATVRQLVGAKVGHTFRVTSQPTQDFITLEVSFQVRKANTPGRDR